MQATRKTQPSRKGKKAWRKNVDVDDINAALEAKREKEILHGDEDEGFVIDTVGDDGAKATAFKLKAREILENKSKVPAVQPKKVKHKVSKAHAKKLMALAGRLTTETALKARVDRDGIVRAKNLDVWADEPEIAQPEIYKKTAFKPYTKATRAPRTLAHAPIKLDVGGNDDDLVHAGKSYNPALESWKALIDREFNSEQDLEVKRQAMEEHQKRIQYLIETLDDNEIDESNDEGVEEDEEEDVDDENKYKLSLNERTELKIKTKTRRNREARNKQRRELEAKLRLLKQQIRDLARLEEIEEQVDEKEANQKPRAPKKYLRHGKNEITFKPIEVKLSDELTNNLRGVKPEGNLLYEQMHKLQQSGRVEARIPIRQKRKYARKFTEKWSYKDFK